MRAQGPPELAELGDELLASKGSKEQGAAASSGFGADTSRSKRSLARCRRGRGRRQQQKGATTMGSQRLRQGKKALVLGASEEGRGDGAGHGDQEEWRREGSRRGSRELRIGRWVQARVKRRV